MGDVYRLAYDQELFGVQFTNVFHYDNTVPPSGADDTAEDLARGFESSVHDSFRSVLSDDWSGVCVRVARIDPEAGSEFGLITTPQAGQVGFEALPTNQCVKFSWYTALLSRRGRGRSFISGVPFTEESESVLTGSARGILQSLLAAIAAELTGSGGVGKYSVGIWSTVNKTIMPILTGEVRQAFVKHRNRTSTSCVTA